ncbi:hypothetical protein PNP85_08020 [Halobacterium salinarum]|uniref:hypothetical protein n=1 Tax=Halobacterium salinarum TaxID=2242 RepID=UPI002555B712|nr:hypothetical protein [Halobacterium salinarum]MDL0136858.1 hypothetical protein [Halobacterium salinarum]MDL0139448.1 hypothetical protein [Halobacterium salinarum]
MKLQVGDRFLAEISSTTSSSVNANTDEWSNVSDIVVDPKVAATVLTPGREITVEVEKLSGQTAFVSQVRGSYSRHDQPGDEIEATATKHLRGRLCEGTIPSGSNLDRLILVGAYPGDVVSATLQKIRDKIGFARADTVIETGHRRGDSIEVETVPDSWQAHTVEGGFAVELDRFAHVRTTCSGRITDIDSAIEVTLEDTGDLPTEGETVTATTIPESTKVTAKDGEYDITTEEAFHVKAHVEVEITEIDGADLAGTIRDIKALPREGNIVQAKAEEGDRNVRVSKGRYEAELSSPALATGQVEIQFTDVEGETRRAEIHSYGDSLPEIGDKVEGLVAKSKGIARPANYDCRITLRGEIPKHGDATIEITRISDEVAGKVVEYQRQSGEDIDLVGSKNEILNNTNL